MKMPDLKMQFKFCMRHLYPNGSRILPIREHKVLIFTFIMGWIEALKATGQVVDMQMTLKKFVDTTKENFVPDQSWHWDAVVDVNKN